MTNVLRIWLTFTFKGFRRLQMVPSRLLQGRIRFRFSSDSDSASDLDSVDVLACVGLPDLGATWGFALRGFTVWGSTDLGLADLGATETHLPSMCVPPIGAGNVYRICQSFRSFQRVGHWDYQGFRNLTWCFNQGFNQWIRIFQQDISFCERCPFVGYVNRRSPRKRFVFNVGYEAWCVRLLTARLCLDSDRVCLLMWQSKTKWMRQPRSV